MLKLYSLERKKMFCTGPVSVTRGQVSSALRQWEKKTLNTPSGFSLGSNGGRKTQKESQELFSLSQRQNTVCTQNCILQEEARASFKIWQRGRFHCWQGPALLSAVLSATGFPWSHLVNARQSLCFSASQQQVCSHAKDWRSKEHKGWEGDVVLNKTIVTNLASAKPTGLAGSACHFCQPPAASGRSPVHCLLSTAHSSSKEEPRSL